MPQIVQPELQFSLGSVLVPSGRATPHAQVSVIQLPRWRRYATLDIWRGVACLMVVLQHATEYSRRNSQGIAAKGLAQVAINMLGQGWLGVVIFFVISGYCIAATCDSQRQ